MTIDEIDALNSAQRLFHNARAVADCIADSRSPETVVTPALRGLSDLLEAALDSLDDAIPMKASL